MSKYKLMAFIIIELFLYYATPAALFFLSNNLVQRGATYLKQIPLIGTPATYYLVILWAFFCVFLISMVYAGVYCQIKYSIRDRMIICNLQKSNS